MKVIGIIPARYGSTRFEGKVLADLLGKPLIQHVYERTRRAKSLEAVYVATDDERVAKAVQRFGGRAIMTSGEHASGTDRIAEAAKELEADVVVNVQGDEPLIEAEVIEAVVEPFRKDLQLPMSTAVSELTAEEDPNDPNIVKAVCDKKWRALYFSRSLIPYPRYPGKATVYKHLGIYAYRRAFLMLYPTLPRTPLEQAESLEQLRALEHGHRIQCVLTRYSPVSVDTPEDLEVVRGIMERLQRSGD